MTGAMWAWEVAEPGPIENGPLSWVEKPIPTAGSGELLVHVRACGVCRTDLHVSEGDLETHLPHVTPGHEVVGTVATVGEDVNGYAVGDRVGIAWLRHTDATCRYCVRGAENLCPSSTYTGWDSDGGYAEYLTVPAAFAYPLPDGLDDVAFAPLLCAGIIGYHALVRADLPPGGRLGLYGFGGSAHLCAQVALARGATVHVLTRDERAQRLARELGAASVGGAYDSPPEPQLRSVTSNTRRLGREFLDIAASFGVRATTHTYSLSRAQQALQDLKAGLFEGAAVLINDVTSRSGDRE